MFIRTLILIITLFSFFLEAKTQVTADFSPGDSTGCIKQNVFSFKNNTVVSSGSATYSWFFGDGDTSHRKNPTHSYSFSDTFIVKLVATHNPSGTKDSMEKKLVVFPQPVPGFSVNDTQQCLPGNAFNFKNLSSVPSGGMTYKWDFKDGNSSAQVDPANNYKTPGEYEVSLIVSTFKGCSDTTSLKIHVFPVPKPAFSAPVVCEGDTTSLKSTSSISTGAITQLLWIAKKGDTLRGKEVKTLLPGGGEFPVTLIVQSENGCTDSLTKDVRAGFLPKAGFTGTLTCNGDSSIFKNTTVLLNDSVAYRQWNFGDGTFFFGKEGAHVFPDTGTFPVSLIVVSEFNCIDSFQSDITVFPKPQGGFTAGFSCLGDTTFFTDTSRIASGFIKSYFWDHSNGDTSFTKNTFVRYTSAGDYKVRLIVESDAGCRDTVTGTQVIGYKPSVYPYVENICQLKMVNFKDSSTIPGNMIISRVWEISNGFGSTMKNPSFKFDTSGTFNVRLKVFTDIGCADSADTSFTVFPKPRADFTTEISCLGKNTVFVDQSTIKTGTIARYEYLFGEGSGSTLKDPKFMYPALGEYNARHVVRSDNFCYDTVFKKVEVTPVPVSKIEMLTVQDQCLETNRFKVKNNSTIQSGVLFYEWLAGNGDTLTTQSFNYSYDSAGKYELKLIATSNSGCKDSVSKTLWVYPTPKAGFTINNKIQCLGMNNFKIKNESTVSSGSLGYLWVTNKEDKDTLLARDVTITYGSPGKKPLTLIVVSDKGCVDTLSDTNLVIREPEANFFSPAVCLGEPMIFYEQSKPVEGSLVEWEWDFGDSTFAKGPSQSHNYLFAGKKSVRLIVTSSFGCTDTFTRQATVYGAPGRPTLKYVSVINDKAVELSWNPVPSGNPGSYFIERSLNGTDFIPVASINHSTFFYRDKNVNVDTQYYYYRIRMTDSCGNTGIFSDTARTILSKVETSQRFPLIRWTGYSGWDVARYEVQIRDSSGMNFNTIPGYADLPPDSLYTLDRVTGENEYHYCYRIIAHKKGEEEIISISNVDCLPTELILHIPNAFSPNGDKFNDVFKIRGIYVLNFNIVIFNRWGKVVYEGGSLNESWDGTNLGDPVPDGVYTYILVAEGTNGQHYETHGKITLYR